MKKLEKIEKVEPPRRRKTVHFDFPPPPRSGEDVAKLEGVHKAYGSRSIYDGLDFLVRRRERWCVMGVNGAGKSTLLKLVAGDAARRRHGGGRRQREDGLLRAARDGAARRREDGLADARGRVSAASVGSLRTLAGCFGFSGDDVEKSCRVLSGGEKARLVLALMLYDPPNFLVLDEPTNHLDLATKEMLIKALAGFEGTMLFVSHDRHFLARSPIGCSSSPPRLHALRRRLHRVRGPHRPRGAGPAELRRESRRQKDRVS